MIMPDHRMAVGWALRALTPCANLLLGLMADRWTLCAPAKQLLCSLLPRYSYAGAVVLCVGVSEREIYVERRMRENFEWSSRAPFRKRRDLTLDPFSMREFLARKRKARHAFQTRKAGIPAYFRFFGENTPPDAGTRT